MDEETNEEEPKRSAGSILTYEQMQKNKHKRILKEQREAEKPLDLEEDAALMGVR